MQCPPCAWGFVGDTRAGGCAAGRRGGVLGACARRTVCTGDASGILWLGVGVSAAVGLHERPRTVLSRQDACFTSLGLMRVKLYKVVAFPDAHLCAIGPADNACRTGPAASSSSPSFGQDENRCTNVLYRPDADRALDRTKTGARMCCIAPMRPADAPRVTLYHKRLGCKLPVTNQQGGPTSTAMPVKRPLFGHRQPAACGNDPRPIECSSRHPHDTLAQAQPTSSSTYTPLSRPPDTTVPSTVWSRLTSASYWYVLSQPGLSPTGSASPCTTVRP